MKQRDDENIHAMYDPPVDEPEDPITEYSKPDLDAMADRAADRYLDSMMGHGL